MNEEHLPAIEQFTTLIGELSSLNRPYLKSIDLRVNCAHNDLTSGLFNLIVDQPEKIKKQFKITRERIKLQKEQLTGIIVDHSARPDTGDIQARLLSGYKVSVGHMIMSRLDQVLEFLDLYEQGPPNFKL